MIKLPLLSIKFPRVVHAVHQIEITSRCNLRCVYCPSPQIMKGEHPNRPAMDMDLPTFAHALRLAEFYVKTKGTQTELNLAGIGESTMHPQFLTFLSMARSAVGPDCRIVLATNGLIAEEDFVAAMVPYNPRIWVSLHRPEKAARALEVYKRHGLAEGISTDPSTFPNDWAGQVKWIKSSQEMPCPWLRNGRVFVLADGRIAACCLNVSGNETIGHVRDFEPGKNMFELENSPWSACKTCYQTIGVKGYEQWVKGETP